MRSLLRLFARFGGFFLFVLLEGICFYLIVNSKANTKQSQIWASSANVMTGYAYDRYDAAVDYLTLNKKIDKLMRENAALRAQLENARDPLDTLGPVTATVRLDTARQVYTYIPADVINNSVNRNNNTFTLDRGRRDGVEPGMGVITEDGVAGIVRSVSQHYAAVLSILHRDVRISARIKRNNEFGSLAWTGEDPRFMELQAVPKYVEVNVDDTIVTSGHSLIFPADLYIGKVVETKVESGNNFHDIKVLLGVNMRQLRHAYVVKNLRREELDKLTEEAANE